MVEKDGFYILKFAFLLLVICLCISTSAYSQQQTGSYPTITKFIGSNDFTKYGKLVILPFSDAPNASGTGQLAQGIASMIFAKEGFQIVDRARLYNTLNEQNLLSNSLIDENHSIRVGKLLSVNAVVIGEVGQYQMINRHTDSAYEAVYPEVDPWTAAYISSVRGPDAVKELYKPKYVLKPGQQWTESFVSVALRVIDVETGMMIYSAAGQYNQGHINPPQQLLEYILQALVRDWTGSISQIESTPKNTSNYVTTCEENCSEMYRKRELKIGITIGDCIRTLCK